MRATLHSQPLVRLFTLNQAGCHPGENSVSCRHPDIPHVAEVSVDQMFKVEVMVRVIYLRFPIYSIALPSVCQSTGLDGRPDQEQ